MLMNALLHEMIDKGWIDADYVEQHAVGFEELVKRVENYPPEAASEVCDVPVEQIREAARIIGTAERLMSTVLQGFYHPVHRHRRLRDHRLGGVEGRRRVGGRRGPGWAAMAGEGPLAPEKLIEEAGVRPQLWLRPRRTAAEVPPNAPSPVSGARGPREPAAG